MRLGKLEKEISRFASRAEFPAGNPGAPDNTSKLPMKKTLLLAVATCALFAQVPGGVQAAPESDKHKHHAAAIAEMCKEREVRLMMLRELTNSRERKMEVAHMLKDDSEFREVFGNLTTGGG